MELQDPAVEFRSSSGALYTKFTSDHRWYKVQGSTKTLYSIMYHRNRSFARNMINMDLFSRVVKDLNSNPDGSLDGPVANLQF